MADENRGRRGRRPGPRIRSIKPEMFQNEKIGRLSDKGFRLFVGLISMSDDEGRFRALPSFVKGHCLPYDRISEKRIRRLMRELVDHRIVVLYEENGVDYGAFRNWRKHQQVTRPVASTLPPPPDIAVVAANSIDADANSSMGKRDEYTGNACKLVSPPRAGADPDPDPVPSSSSTSVEEDTVDARAGARRRRRSKTVDQAVLDADTPPELAERAHQVLARLRRLHEQRGGNVPQLRGVGLALAGARDRDHLAVLTDLEFWALSGRGANRPIIDWVAQYRNFLKNAPQATPGRPASRGFTPTRWGQPSSEPSPYDTYGPPEGEEEAA